MEDSNKKDWIQLYKLPMFGHARTAGNFKHKKIGKKWKKALTVEDKHDIIIKLSARAAVLKKKIGFFKKGLDKLAKTWYNNQVASNGSREKPRKKNKKSLDKTEAIWYNNLVAKRRNEAARTLKIKQYEKQVTN